MVERGERERVERPRFLEGAKGIVLGVSGESSVGFSIAERLRAHGAEVAITYRPSRKDEGPRLAARAGASLALPLDVNDDDSMEAAFARVRDTWDGLDFVVHTIVSVPPMVLERSILDLSRADFYSVMGPSVHSLIAACRHAAPLLRRSKSPRVVTLTSASGMRMTPRYHAVGLAKAALLGAVSYLAYELGPMGILCNAVSFSLIETDGAKRAVGESAASATRAHLAKRSPTRRPLEREHVAGTVAFLASSLCENMTGEIVTVDGGYSRVYV